MEENLEQPLLEGSNQNFGKFKDADSLLKAYNNLEAEFTKKSQKLATLETEVNKNRENQSKQAEIERKVEEFVTKFEIAKPFSSAIKESLANDSNATLETEAMRQIANNYKSAKDYANDSEFLNNYIYSNNEIKEVIIKDYLKNITQNSPIKVQSGASKLSLTPPIAPSSLKEAGKLAKSIIKQK